MKSELQKMLSGEMYDCNNKTLVKMRENCRSLLRQYNVNPDKKLLEKIFKSKLKKVHIEPYFCCDYGENIAFGKSIYINFNCVILDCAKVKIGDNTLIAPGVHIYTATHPISPKERLAEKEYALPVIIGKNVWIGGGAIILPGVEIGDNSIIGAGSLVTKSIPPNYLAIGNPCKPVKKINE